MNTTDEHAHDNKMLPQLVEDITKSKKNIAVVVVILVNLE